MYSRRRKSLGVPLVAWSYHHGPDRPVAPVAPWLTRIVCAAAVVCFNSAGAWAENPPPLETAEKEIVPAGVPSLPDSASGAAITINSANVAAWKSILVPELVSTVRAGELALVARKELGYRWRIDDAWEAQSRRNGADRTLALVDGSTALRADVAINYGYPFGGESEVLVKSSPGIVGARVAWNAHGAWWGFGSLAGDFETTWLKKGRPVRVVRGRFLRAYPASLGAEPSAQIFREKIVFESPAALAGLTWLTYRFLGSDEDMVWFYSPALGKARQLTGSNRADALARGTVSADDLLVWSGKVELVDAIAEQSFVGLVPFPGPELGRVESGRTQGCFLPSHGGSAEERGASALDSAAVDPAAILSGATFVPRRLWRVELTSNDPYSLYGRQVLYVDKASMLPAYKFVYNRSGQLWKTVVGTFGLATAADRLVKVPFLHSQIVIDHIREETNVINMTTFEVCREPSAETAAAMFEPRKLWPSPTATPGPKKRGAKAE